MLHITISLNRSPAKHGKKDAQINSVDWRFECYRLQSFSNVEGNESVSFVCLAKDMGLSNWFFLSYYNY